MRLKLFCRNSVLSQFVIQLITTQLKNKFLLCRAGTNCMTLCENLNYTIISRNFIPSVMFYWKYDNKNAIISVSLSKWGTQWTHLDLIKLKSPANEETLWHMCFIMWNDYYKKTSSRRRDLEKSVGFWQTVN